MTFLFCSLTCAKNGYSVRKCNKGMSYSSLCDKFKRTLSQFVEDFSKFCLHSLRLGGASCATDNGVKDRMFERHGRWLK